MSEKILFTDLDGTLLNSAKKVSPGMQLLLSKMVLAGNRLVLTSGRALPSVLKVAKNAGLLFPDTVIIAANGNEVYDCDTKTFLMRKSVPIEIAEDIISMAQEESLYLHSYSDTCVVAPKDGVEVKHYCSRTGMEYQVSDDLLKTIGHAPCKLLAIDMENHGRLEEFRSRIQEKYGDKISAIFPIRFILKFSIRPPGRETLSVSSASIFRFRFPTVSLPETPKTIFPCCRLPELPLRWQTLRPRSKPAPILSRSRITTTMDSRKRFYSCLRCKKYHE